MADISVTVSDGHLQCIDSVAAALRDNGMVVHQVLEAIGVISGTSPEGRRHALEAVDGVEAIENVQTFYGPPPGPR